MTTAGRPFRPEGLTDIREPGLPLVPGRVVALGLMLSAACVAAQLYRHNIGIAENIAACGVFAALGALALFRWTLRGAESGGHRTARDATEYLGCFALISLLGVMATYPAAADTRGFHDATLHQFDRILHFDWLAWYAFTVKHPLLQWGGQASYALIYVSPAILLLHYAHADKRAEARLFLTSFWVAILLTLAFFPFMAAEGPLATLWHGPVPYLPTSGLYQQTLIPELRAGAVPSIDMGALRGLVCAPSFHAASALVYTTAGWRVPRLRAPIFALNSLMLLATPVEGTHYLSDLLIGMAVALLAIALTRLAIGQAPQLPHRIARVRSAFAQV